MSIETIHTRTLICDDCGLKRHLESRNVQDAFKQLEEMLHDWQIWSMNGQIDKIYHRCSDCISQYEVFRTTQHNKRTRVETKLERKP